jgi:ABC-type transport system involved in multi-copper enzyme maturation permease subunit
MKWLEIVRFEIVCQLRRRSTWFFFALFLIPLIGVTSEALKDARNSEDLFNAPLAIAERSVVMGMVSLLILAGVAGDAATRDVRTRLEPLMHAAPVGRAAYLGGRFLGAFLAAAVLVAVVPLVHILVPLFQTGLEPEVVGTFRPAAYLQAYGLLLLPNAWVATALMFALATLVRHTVGGYAVAAFMLAGAQLGIAFIAEALGRWNLASLLDSSGLIAVELMGRTWPPAELNERLIGSAGALLWNRLLWLAIASGALVITYRRFDFGGDPGAVRWWQRGRLRASSPGLGEAAAARPGGAAVAAPGRSVPVAVPRTPRGFGAAGRVRQALAIARDSLREVSGWSWVLLPLLAIQVLGHREAIESMGAGTRVLPTTDRVLAPLEDVAPPVVLLIILFPVLLAGELVWRERDANMEAVADAAPAPNGVRFTGKLLALWLVFAVLQALQVLAGLLTQVWLGWYDFAPALYFQFFGLGLVDALLFASFAMSVHVVVNQKHVGHLLVMVLVVGPRLLAEVLRIDHPLLIPGYEPSWRHSPISGFGPFVGPVLSFELYWAAWTVLLALVAWLFWIRGVEPGLRERVRIARRRFGGWIAGAIAAALGLVLLVGGFVFYNTNVLNAYQSPAQSLQRQAEYERTYGEYRGAPQPQLTATELEVELYPERCEAEVRGVHHLVNRTAQPIDTIHVAVSSEVETGEIELGRPARSAVLDDRLSQRVYALEQPLQPGDSLQLGWQVRYHPRGFPARGIGTAVVGNGSFIEMASWMPLIGYQPHRELTDAGERRAHGLVERPDVPSLDDVQARHDPAGRELVDLTVTVGTAAGQLAIAPGELQESWEQGGRRYFRYATAAPIGLGYAIFSADYAVREARFGDVALEVVHHPAHDLNVERMLRGMQASLEQFTQRFGPFAHGVLRMVEYPGDGGGSLHATPGTIWYQELFSLFDPDHEARRIDLPFAVTAHEVAHQFQPAVANVEGRSLLSESFAWYAALGVIEQQYGEEHLARFLDFMRESYRDPRSRADVPLLRASDFFLGYRKGPFAMYALREYVGQESVDLAWRRLREQDVPPFVTSLDLYRELQEVTPDSLQGLLGDLLERNTFWELSARQACVQQAPSGEWQVALDVVARKVVVATEGVETDLPMDDLIEIGVYAPAQPGQARRALHLAMHRIGTGPQTIAITVPERPARAGIDPRHLLIDVEPFDNLVDVPDPSSSSD